ncbi:MAG: AI-2E family transporter [Chloroflexi bacterium]|nr:AI-2E family transporter [Chloroflexota bacterium]
MAPSRWTPVTKRIALLVLVAAGVLLMARLGELVFPFVWAFILGYVLLPVVALIERRTGMRRGFAAGIVFLVIVGSIAVLLRVVAPLAIGEVRDLQRALPALLTNAQGTVGDWLDSIGAGDLKTLVFVQGTQGISLGLGRMIVPLATAIGRFALELLIFLIAVFFVLRDAPRVFEAIRGLIPREHRVEIVHIGDQVSLLISRYIRGQLVLVALMASVTTIGLSLLGLPYAVVLGIATGWLELVPIVGPITAGAIASVVALGHQNPFGWSQLSYVVVVIVMYTVLRHAEDYFVIPLVIGRIVRLHPIVVIFSVLAGGALLGLLGVVLAVPTVAALRLVLVYVMAKLRDEDPLVKLEREIEETTGTIEAAEARALPRQA